MNTLIKLDLKKIISSTYFHVILLEYEILNYANGYSSRTRDTIGMVVKFFRGEGEREENHDFYVRLILLQIPLSSPPPNFT